MDAQARNTKIFAMRRQGAKFNEIAATFDMSSGRVSAICKQIAAIAKERPIPDGLSLRTAKAIEGAFGVWPSDETANEIAGRRDEWLRAHGIGRKQYLEIEAWLARE